MGLKKLSPKHHELAVMTACGKSPTEISEKLGMHENAVHRLLRDQAILAVMSDGRRQIDERVIVETCRKDQSTHTIGLESDGKHFGR